MPVTSESVDQIISEGLNEAREASMAFTPDEMVEYVRVMTVGEDQSGLELTAWALEYAVTDRARRLEQPEGEAAAAPAARSMDEEQKKQINEFARELLPGGRERPLTRGNRRRRRPVTRTHAGIR